MKLTICRGLPGSGKSTLAVEILYTQAVANSYDNSIQAPIILSADDYFTVGGIYYFDPSQLYKAHSWNQWRCGQLIQAGRNVIVDNTNTTWKEVEPYAAMAKDQGYDIEVVEPNTPWAFDIGGLMARGTHGVPRETYEKMLARWESTESIKEKIGKL